MFFSLIEVLLSNISGRSNIFIQPLATTINGFFWSIYGYGKKDWFIITPNLLAMILGVITATSAFM